MKKTVLCIIITFCISIFIFFTPKEANAINETNNLLRECGVINSSQITATTIYDSSIEKPEYTNYSVSNDNIVIIPVKASSTGIMYLDTYIENMANTQNVVTGLYNTEEDAINWMSNKNNWKLPADISNERIADTYAEEVDFKSFEYKRSAYGTITGDNHLKLPVMLPVSNGKTYYLAICNCASNDSEYNSNELIANVSIKTYIYTTADKSVKVGDSKWIMSSGINSSLKQKETWFKVVPANTGVLKVKIKSFLPDYAECDVMLYDKNKNALSCKYKYYENSYSWVMNDYIFFRFGVEKNKTYYVRVRGYSTYCEEDMRAYDSLQKYGIKCSLIKYTDRLIGTKNKAKKLVRTAKRTNTLFVATGKKSTDWYKIYLPKKKKTQIGIDTSDMDTGACYVSIYKGNKQIGKTKTVSSGSILKCNITYGRTKGKADKGCYYIKIVKGKKCSGVYHIRYNY